MFSTDQTGHVRWIAGYILSKGESRVAARDIMRHYGALRAPEMRQELLDVMSTLEVMGWVRAERRRDGTPAAWEVNPTIQSRFAERAAKEREAREATKDRIRASVAGYLARNVANVS
jgi:hypothetical protein